MGRLVILRRQAGIRLIENATNRGFPAGCNQAMRIATGDQILLLNNDTIVTPGWLGRLLSVLKAHPDVGLVGPVSNYVSGVQCVQSHFSTLETLEAFAHQWARDNAGQVHRTERLVGFCLLIKRAVIDRIGLLDEQFGLGNFEDDDYVRRAREAGFEAVIAREAFIHHFGSISFFALGAGRTPFHHAGEPAQVRRQIPAHRA